MESLVFFFRVGNTLAAATLSGFCNSGGFGEVERELGFAKWAVLGQSPETLKTVSKNTFVTPQLRRHITQRTASEISSKLLARSRRYADRSSPFFWVYVFVTQQLRWEFFPPSFRSLPGLLDAQFDADLPPSASPIRVNGGC